MKSNIFMGVTSTISAKTRGINMVTVTATSQNRSSNISPRGAKRAEAAKRRDLALIKVRATNRQAIIGAGVKVRPAVICVGITAKEPNGMVAKNR